jgi:hypothetical protein
MPKACNKTFEAKPPFIFPMVKEKKLYKVNMILRKQEVEV